MPSVPLASLAALPHPAVWLLALSGFLGGVLVGLAGMGGGALMTPMLVLLFRIDPKVAIASDLVNSLVMKPVGGAVHARQGSVHWGLVGRLVAGGVPAAFLGAWTLNQLGDTAAAQARLKTLLGWALVVALGSMLTKSALSARLGRARAEADAVPERIRSAPTVLAGMVGGFIVGMTSVGSGSLIVVLMMLLHPRLSGRVQVGTNLVQAIPLVASATLGQLLFGRVDLAVAGALVVGSVPGAYLGASVSARARGAVVRAVLVAVLVASALALLIRSDAGLVRAFALAAVVGLPLWAAADAALGPSEPWAAAGRNRTSWVALLGVGAPLGVGLLAALIYVVRVRPGLTVAAPPPPRRTLPSNA